MASVMEATTLSKTKDIDVKITTTGDSKDPYKLKWKKSFLGFPYWGDPPLDTQKDYNMWLRFTLDDKAGTGVGFATPVTAAFGANAGAGNCPKAGSDAGGQIDFDDSSGSSTDLSILDVNSKPGDIQFAVFFNDGTEIDPIIKNTGGGGTPPSS